jgi:hypothetical protein
MMDDINEIIKSSENRNVEEVINNDINKQQDVFKKKLFEKRTKSSISEIEDNYPLNQSVN